MLSVMKKAGRGLGEGKRTSTKPSPPLSLDDCEVENSLLLWCQNPHALERCPAVFQARAVSGKVLSRDRDSPSCLPPGCGMQGPPGPATWSCSPVSPLRGIALVVVQSLSRVQLFCKPMDHSPPGSSFPGISQARILEWVAISFFRGSSQPKDQTPVSCTGWWILYHWATREAPRGISIALIHHLVWLPTIPGSRWQCLYSTIEKLRFREVSSLAEDGQNKDLKPRSLPPSMLTAQPLRKLCLKHPFPAHALHSCLCRCTGNRGCGRESPADEAGPVSWGRAPTEQAETQEAPKVKGTPTRPEPDLTGEDAQTPTMLPLEPGPAPSEPGPSYSEPDPAPRSLAPPTRSLPRPLRSLAPPCREGVWTPRLSTPPPFPGPGVRSPQAASLQVL